MLAWGEACAALTFSAALFAARRAASLLPMPRRLHAPDPAVPTIRYVPLRLAGTS